MQCMHGSLRRTGCLIEEVTPKSPVARTPIFVEFPFCPKFWMSLVSSYSTFLLPYVSIVVQIITFGLGLGTEFRSEKIPRNRLGTVSVIPRKKVLIPRHSEAFRVPRKSQFQSSEVGTDRIERNSAKKLSFMELAQPLWPL
jgi:hypothetical protein